MFEFLQKHVVAKRPPDFVIGREENPYLYRWYLLPRNRILNIYLHLFLRDDDDRALHCHPWANCSLLLKGSYTEHQIAPGGVHVRSVLNAGDFRIRWSGKLAHRIELHQGPCWTLFITGPKYREWGFHCVNGWRHWKDFTAPHDKGQIGRGCD
jgi:hypothetical protein